MEHQDQPEAPRPRRGSLSWRELQALTADRRPPPPRRLTGPELETLRRRLNEEDFPALSVDEQSGRYELGIIRYTIIVDDLVQRVQSEALDVSPEASSRIYARGILDAVAWARGERREGPVTSRIPRTHLPSTIELEGEASNATEALQGARRAGHSPSYVVGAEACLLWLVCNGPDPWT